MLNIYFQYLANLRHLLEAISPRDPNPYITLVVNKRANTVSLIGGTSEALQVLTLPIPRDSVLKTGSMSFDSMLIKLYLLPQINLSDQGCSVTLELHYEGKDTLPHFKGLTKDNAWRAEHAKPACEPHLNHYNKLKNLRYQKIQTKTMKSILAFANDNKPLEAFELNKDTKQVHILRQDEKLHPLALPEHIEPEINLLLNYESVMALNKLCQSTDAKTLQVHMDNDQAIFSDGYTTVSESLLSLADYDKKATVIYAVETKIIADASEFEIEIKDHSSIPAIHRRNSSYLYINEDRVVACGTREEIDCAKELTHIDIKMDEEKLYRFRPTDIKSINIKGITNANAMKLQVLVAEDGHRVLGFYSDTNRKDPYVTIPIELDFSELDKVLKIINEYKARLPTSQSQEDLFGFDDI
ncbi:hypothetical protein AB4403_17705 [Vibrio breoganii]